MLNIRLQRRGRKNDPSFRVIVADSKKKPKTGNYLEMLGSYDPRTNRTEIKGDRVLHWIKNGAKPSDTVHNLLVTQKIIDAKKINILPAFKAAPVEAAPEAPAASETNEVSTETAADAAPQEETVTNDVAQEETTS